MTDDKTPVLIGCGQVTQKIPPEQSALENAATPIDLMVVSARRAALDAGPGEKLLQALDGVAAISLVVDSPEAKSTASRMIRNVPQTVCNRLCIDPEHKRYAHSGGNTPQMLVNLYAEQISQGELNAVLLTGAEALNSMIRRLKAGLSLDYWADDSHSDPEMLGLHRSPASEHELGYELEVPATTYPLFENSLRGKYGLSLQGHRDKLGTLFAEFSKVAAQNPLSWFPIERSASEISTPSDSNRYVGFPYTKFLNAIIQVNQGASVIMTSVAKARELGVEDHRMVYLHGCADANDIWNVTDRINFHSSPAIKIAGEKALKMAGKTIADMDYFDIYSCFPAAVQIACDELGIAHDDPRGLTVTGGLPYFGGPGNNYVMHSIATMMDKLRASPGTYGLLNANGWFVTKHALGIYSTTPTQGAWERETPASYQADIDKLVHPTFTETPSGASVIETYTILHGRKGVERGLIIGRLQDGTRFLAELPANTELLMKFTEIEGLGTRGFVSRHGDKNVFVPEMD